MFLLEGKVPEEKQRILTADLCRPDLVTAAQRACLVRRCKLRSARNEAVLMVNDRCDRCSDSCVQPVRGFVDKLACK